MMGAVQSTQSTEIDDALEIAEQTDVPAARPDRVKKRQEAESGPDDE